MADTVVPEDGERRSDSDGLNYALRIGLATHPRFPRVVHQRLALDCLYEHPTQRLSAQELTAKISERFEGIQLTNQQTRNALDDLAQKGWLDVEPENRSGIRRYGLSAKGGSDWEAARTAGLALEGRVKNAFLSEIGFSGDATACDSVWAALLDRLDDLFRREAFDVARALVDGDRLANVVERRTESPSGEEEEQLAQFIRTASGDRQIFLRKLMNGALSYHLFRANPQADEAVRRHLQGRTFYVDTSVLYSLVARRGELAALRDDLLRIIRDLKCRLRITTQTLREFHDSIRYYRSLLEKRGITDQSMARALLSPQSIQDLDDFRRGYYQALLEDPTITIELYALPYETIEEQLTTWGFPRAEVVPEGPEKNQAGEWVTLEGLAEYEESLAEYLRRHPRRGREDEPLDSSAIHHDAAMVAWIQRQRTVRGISMPARPSQVDTWFLTRDRKLTNWDREFVVANGLGRVSRCLPLDDWIEGIAILSPTIQESEAAASIALRALAVVAPPAEGDESLTADELEEVGRAAQIWNLHPNEASRMAADKQFARELRAARQNSERFEALKAGVLRLKDAEIEALRANELISNRMVETSRSRADAAAERAKFQELLRSRADAERIRLKNAKAKIEPDANFGQLQRRRGPAAIILAAVLASASVIALTQSILWQHAYSAQKAFLLICTMTAVVCAVMWVAGFRRTVVKVVGGIALGVGLATGLVQWFQYLGERPESAKAAPAQKQPPARSSATPTR